MIAWKFAATALVANYGWPIAIPILGLIFGYALMVDYREKRRKEWALLRDLEERQHFEP